MHLTRQAAVGRKRRTFYEIFRYDMTFGIALFRRSSSRFKAYIKSYDGIGLGESDTGTAAVDPAHDVIPDVDGIIPVA